jgi:hypothetical protein
MTVAQSLRWSEGEPNVRNGRNFGRTPLGARENWSRPPRVWWLGLAVLGVLFAIPKIGAPAEEQSPVAAVTSQNGKVRVEILSLKRTEGNTGTTALACRER